MKAAIQSRWTDGQDEATRGGEQHDEHEPEYSGANHDFTCVVDIQLQVQQRRRDMSNNSWLTAASTDQPKKTTATTRYQFKRTVTVSSSST